jgi:serine/threonine-protein kinase
VATASGHGGTPADVVLETGGGWFGTPPYMSPEAANAEPAAPSFDLWALAVVLYESMAGARPFRGQDAWETLERIRTSPAPDIRDVWSDAPAPVAAFFETALALDPARRPPDAAAFGAALRRLRDRIG